MLKLYTLSNCSTCRRAVKWLRDHDIDFDERAIRETPPSPAELRTMLRAKGGAVRTLFNTSGQDYREQKLAEVLPTLSTDEAVALLARNGRLVRRPFAIGNRVALVGFKEKEWETALGKA